MKKSIIASITAVAIAFVTAVGLCVRCLWGAQAVAAFDQPLKVVVDAGHGGVDGGVVGRKTGVKESDVNLAIAFELCEVLTDMGVDVVMTRKTEAGLYDTATKGFKKRDMQRRKEIAEEAKPDFLISVHQNAYPSSRYRGGQVFYNAEDESGEKLAILTQNALNALYAGEGAKARTHAKGDFFMLKCYSCPSLLIECGFLSNAADEALLQSAVWQRKLAETIASGLVAYLSEAAA
ncbi:MAG: N-acetylmuramoyl-L-alanine amidase [Clostridia bacterium]|nr:N-acetylmuramoyl-L-alanine amidase [Clostridia bacterium]